MLNYFIVAMIVSLLTLTSYSYGSLIQSFFNWNISKYLNVLLGFSLIIGVLNFIVYPIVIFKLNTSMFMGIVFFILILPIFFYRKIQWFKLNRYLIIFSLIVIIRLLITYQRGLAEESFDTVHYLSYIIEAAKGTFFTEFDVNGGVRTWILPLDDFSSYYYVLATLYRSVEFIKSQFSMDILTLTMPKVIWISTLFYFILSVSLSFASIKMLKIRNLLHQVIIILLIQFFFGAFYYNSVFGFYGNTYRTLFSGLLVLLIFDALKKHQFKMSHSLMIMITISSILGFSGAGYLSSFIAVYSYILLMLRKNSLSNRNISLIYILFIPIILFVSNYWLFLDIVSMPLLILLLIIYCVLFGITYLFNYSLQHVYRFIIVFLIPISIYGASLIINHSTPIMQDFFIHRSNVDMVWDYFSFDNVRNLFFNTLIWISVLFYSLRSKEISSKYFSTILLIFINPITYPFIVKVMAYDLVYQRSFDAIFNPFTITLLISYLLVIIENNRIIKIGILAISLYLAQYSVFNNYHFYFNSEENYNGFNRLPQDQVEVFEVLNTKIRIEKYDRAVVVSQVPSIKGFVSNVFSVLDYNTYRSIDRFDAVVNPSFSPLWNIFYPRDYYGQSIFSDEPDYSNTCNYLVESRVDFVVLDSAQFYMNDGDYVPLYLRVRECGTEVYRNDRYILYQFYWQ